MVLGGIPGAGKSTLLDRLFGTTGAETQPMRNHDGVLLLDSEQASNHVRRRLQPLPYSLWRLLAHLLQYARIRAAIRYGAPLVVHDCRTAASAVVLDRTTADQLQAIHQQPATPARELAR